MKIRVPRRRKRKSVATITSNKRLDKILRIVGLLRRSVLRGGLHLLRALLRHGMTSVAVVLGLLDDLPGALQGVRCTTATSSQLNLQGAET